MEMTVTFVFEKETKNAWRYRCAPGQAIPDYNSLYVPKVAGKTAPPTIKITVEV
jgi:hypothetical protein